MIRWLLIALLISMNALAEEPSTCYGSTSNGKLKNGVQLPAEGENFVGYSGLAASLGRTYLHSTARDIVVDAYQQLQKELPDKVFKYAETGFAEGGPFKPHKTHQNGLSIDFMVPVLNKKGESVHLPTHPFNKFGYNIEFDGVGKFEEYTIDYEALAAHIVALHKAAEKHQATVWRVIFDPKLQPYLLKTSHAEYIKKRVNLSKKPSWVRHDEHIHVDFTIACSPMPTK
ncbi:MAG: penicillin-insensitive murein endopeptidase [Chromatiales bacterium]|nr:penicillin-insensitive murein endopeptidase [Chromatiales bacterium]